MYKRKQKNKGFILVELLIAMGFISLSSITIYAVANTVNDYRKSSNEVKSLNQAISNIDLSIIDFSKITLSSLNLNSSLNIDNVNNNNNKLNFIYENINTRICNDFSSKMISSSKNILVNINNTDVDNNNLKLISDICVLDNNKVIISLSKSENYTIDTLTASVNLPPPPVPDIVIPTFGGSATLPNVPVFVPSTANPVTYPLTTNTPPTFGAVVGGGGAITVTTPSNPITPSNPSVSTWLPPNVYRPPATPATPDVIDQDPNPPLPPPPFYSKQITACITGYAVESMPFNCINGMVNATLTLTLASPWDSFGRENFIFPAGLEHCNSGEPGFQIGYNQIYPQTTDFEMFWGATAFSNPQKMFLKTFHNINSYMFTCSQTG